MRKLLASLILLIMAINILPVDSSMSDGVSVEYIPPAYSLGIGISPTSKLHVNGTTATKGFTLNGNIMSIPVATQGDILFAKVAGSFSVLNNGTTAKVLTVNGNTLSWKTPSAAGATNIDGLSDGTVTGGSVLLGSSNYADDGTSNYNTALGTNTLDSTITGYHNTAMGYDALTVNTGGNGNSAFGYQSMNGNTTGFQDAAIGTHSLYSNTTGYQNTASGGYSLYSNTSGFNNTATGHTALFSNTTGAYNTAIGTASLRLNTTGDYNTASGVQSLFSNIAGYNNTASGHYSLRYPVTGSRNTAVGYYAGEGSPGDSFSNGTFLGYQTGLDLTTGGSNTLIGFNSGNGITTGSKNITLGYLAGDNITTGSSNIVIGDNIDAPSVSASNQLNIGDSIYGDMSTDQVSIGTTNNYGTLTVEGTLALDETSAPSSSTGYGKVYVNSTDKELYYTASDQTAVKLTNDGAVNLSSSTAQFASWHDSIQANISYHALSDGYLSILIDSTDTSGSDLIGTFLYTDSHKTPSKLRAGIGWDDPEVNYPRYLASTSLPIKSGDYVYVTSTVWGNPVYTITYSWLPVGSTSNLELLASNNLSCSSGGGDYDAVTASGTATAATIDWTMCSEIHLTDSITGTINRPINFTNPQRNGTVSLSLTRGSAATSVLYTWDTDIGWSGPNGIPGDVSTELKNVGTYIFNCTYTSTSTPKYACVWQ